MAKKEKLPKAVDMKDDGGVTLYDGDVSKLIEEYNSNIKNARNNTEMSDVAFLDIGKKLIDIEKKIKYDNKENNVKAKKVFAAFKLRIADKINKNISNVDKAFKVAQFCETEIYQKHKDRLPTGWGTLYLLLSLKNENKELDEYKLEQLMLDENIKNDIKRSELIKKIDAIKSPDKVINQKVTITIEGGEKPTQQQLEDLQKYLNKKLKQWKVTTPEITSEEKTKDSEDTKTE